VTIHDGNSHHAKQLNNIPVVSDLTRTRAISEALGVRHAIVTPELYCKEGLPTFFEEEAPYFDHLIVVPDSVGLSRLLFSSDGLHRLTAQTSPTTSRNGAARLLKRTIDVAAALVIGLIALPVMLLIAVASKLTSPGPVLFGHRRIGQGGREFRVWKFRSMVINGDAVLKDYLECDPKARDEWERTQKLSNDPRVTQLGRILRKTSLDELPQLWNVLVGDMSLIGPRPIIRSECHHYGKHIELYKSVPPGLSGLWQVSGRSDTSYEERVQLDASYVLNWSVWLDLCILVRTIPSMLSGHGAR
jgi:Undecaprenyl-phosphate galactose phosphotransferase WbaP